MIHTRKWQSFVAFVGVILFATANIRAQEATPEPEIEYVFDWPAPMPTDDQIEEAQACDLENLPAERYPEKLKVEDLADAYEPEAACDWAVLAAAYASRAEEDQPVVDQGIDAYIRAVRDNPALAFSLRMLAGYFGAVDLTAPPPLADQPITQLEIEHSWSGLGNPVSYSVKITNADSRPKVTGTVHVEEWGGFETEATPPTPVEYVLPDTVDVEPVQALGASLADLLPMAKPVTDMPCWDNYPDWKVSLTFADGATLVMVTNESNVLFSGGPWQTEIDGQLYMQHSADFLVTLLELRDELGLPVGETAAYGCGSYGDPLFESFD